MWEDLFSGGKLCASQAVGEAGLASGQDKVERGRRTANYNNSAASQKEWGGWVRVWIGGYYVWFHRWGNMSDFCWEEKTIERRQVFECLSGSCLRF